MKDEWLAEIPEAAAIPILGAWQHRSGQRRYNARLEIFSGPRLDELFLLDVSLERWAAVKGNR
jgi:hypothetical protein